MENAADIEKKVQGKEDNQFFGPLFKRMDEDFKLWDLEQVRYEIHETAINITSNDLRTFFDKVQSKLSAAERQIIVRMAEEGADRREEIGKLERLFAFAFEKADERLRRMLLPPLREQLIWFSLARGWAAARILVEKKGDNIVFNIMPWDPRWVTYDISEDGLLWVAYKTFRSQATLEHEYGAKPTNPKDNIGVIDYWEYIKPGKMGNAVIVKGDWYKKPQTLTLPSIPILIMPVSTRPPIITAGTEEWKSKGYGESIFAPSRGINDTLNKFASMWATHANLLAKQPMLHYYTPGETKVMKDTAYFAESVVNLVEGKERIDPTPMQEISPTLVSIFNWLSDQKERATLPHIPVGSPPPSGTMYNLAQEAGEIVYNPQLRNLSYMYADMCHLIEEQMVNSKIKVTVKGEEKRKYYEVQVTPVDLKEPHFIKVEFTAQTPWSQMDTYQVAEMATRLRIPFEWIWENILKIQDPKGLGDQAAIELAEHSPKLAMARAIGVFINQERFDEAEQLMRDMYNMEMQEQMMQEGEGAPKGEAGE